MKMLCLKFHQNLTINEEFDFYENGGGREEGPLRGRRAPIHKFPSHLLLVNILKSHVKIPSISANKRRILFFEERGPRRVLYSSIFILIIVYMKVSILKFKQNRNK